MIKGLFRANAEADKLVEMAPATQVDEWPEGVLARFVTAAGLAFHDQRLVVDLTTSGRLHQSFRCHGCGLWGPSVIGSEEARNNAQGHATVCTGLPRPEAGGHS